MNKKTTTEQNRVIEAYAIIDLAQANVSPTAEAGAWEEEMSFLQRGKQDASSDGGFDDTLVITTLLA